jgi:hypothetical protein
MGVLGIGLNRFETRGRVACFISSREVDTVTAGWPPRALTASSDHAHSVPDSVEHCRLLSHVDRRRNRRKIGRQLNKGESLQALRRDLHYAHQWTVGKPHLADQTEQA